MSIDTVDFFGEPGEAVLQVDPADIKEAWEVSEEERKMRETAGITGLHAVAGGFQSLSLSESEIENRKAVGYRTSLLLALIGYGEGFAPWIEKGQPNEVFIRTMAEIPMEWMKPGVTHGQPFDEEEFMRRLNDPHQ